MTEQFPSDGMMRLAAFEKGLEFDASYFRDTRPAWEGMSDEACLQAWLREGDAGGSCSPKDHLERIGLKLAAYPTAFHWQDYARRRPHAGANRWTALEDFVARGFAEEDHFYFGEDALGFLVALADSYAGRDDRLTIKAFDLAAQHGELPPEERQHLADAYLRQKLWSPARAIYATLLHEGAAHIWTVHNLVRAAIGLNDWSGAFHALVASRRELSGEPLWQKVAKTTISEFFEAQLHVARSFHANHARARADEIVARAVTTTLEMIERLEGSPVTTTKQPGDRVLLFANCDDPPRRRYRVDEKGRQLDSLGKSWTLVPMQDLETFRARLADAGVVIFFDIPASPDTLRAFLAAKTAGVRTFYEVDLPSFDPVCMPAPLSSFRGYMTPHLHDELKVNVQRYRGFARLCDAGLAPTRDIAERLGMVVRTGAAYTLPDGATLDPAREAKQRGRQRMFLRSTRFLYVDSEMTREGAALLDSLRRHEAITLTTSGYIRLSKSFDAVTARITELAASDDPLGHSPALSGACLNLVFEAFPGDSGAAGISWLEAACVGVPTIMAAESARALGLTDGRDCLMVRDPDDWRTAIERLLTEPDLAASIGDAAYAKVAAERALRPLAESLGRALAATAPQRPA